MDLDPLVEQAPQPPEADRPAPVAQHTRAHVRVGGVDRDVERRKVLVDDPFEVDLGEAGQRRKVAVEK